MRVRHVYMYGACVWVSVRMRLLRYRADKNVLNIEYDVALLAAVMQTLLENE